MNRLRGCPLFDDLSVLANDADLRAFKFRAACNVYLGYLDRYLCIFHQIYVVAVLILGLCKSCLDCSVFVYRDCNIRCQLTVAHRSSHLTE